MKKFLLNGSMKEFTFTASEFEIKFSKGEYETNDPNQIKVLESLPFIREAMAGEKAPEEEPVSAAFKVPKSWTINRIYKEADEREINIPGTITGRDVLAAYLENAINK